MLTIKSNQGIQAECSAFGARLISLRLPDRAGRPVDVVLGVDELQAPRAASSYFGATCGRFANRIADGRFTLDGRVYQLPCNEGDHHLHGGPHGFDRRDWSVEDASDHAVVFELLSADGDQGYPGALRARVRYELVEWTLRIEMQATSEAPTIVNLANHAYWNLAGHDAADMLDHEVRVHASGYLPVDAARVPTGQVVPVEGTAFDLREAHPMARALAARPEGFDHCFVIDGAPHVLRPMASVTHPVSGRSFSLHADQPGMQFYTCMHFEGGFPGKQGATYGKFAGLVFESQNFPDAPNHETFPSARLAPGRPYRHVMEYRFTPT